MKTTHQKLSQKMKRRQDRLTEKGRAKGERISLLEWQRRQQVLADQREAMYAYAKVLMDMNGYAKGQEKALSDQVGEARSSGGV